MKDLLNTINTHTDIRLNAVAGLRVLTCELKVIGNPAMSPDKFIPNRIELETIPDQLPANGLK